MPISIAVKMKIAIKMRV